MKERIKSLDSLRTIAILAVLLIHTTTRTLEASEFNIIGFSWTLFLNQIARFAVPLFFTLSGFVLELNYKEGTDYWSFIKKRFSKIFIPYAVWSLIYYLFIYSSNDDNFLRVILTGNASYQLYFIPTLCIFYLLFPLLHRIYRFIANKYILLIILFSQIWFLYQDYFVKEFKFDDPVHIAILAYFLFIIGIVAARKKDVINRFVHKWEHLLFVTAAGAGVYVFREGVSRFSATGNYLSYYSQWRPSILIYTVTLGLILFHIFENTKLQFSLIQKLSRLSFLVFLIHVIILEMLWTTIGKLLFTLMSGNIIGKSVFDLIFFGTTAAVSFLIAFVLHKIPKLQRLIG